MGAKPRLSGHSPIDAIYRKMQAVASGSAGVGRFSQRRVAVALRGSAGELWVAKAGSAGMPPYLNGYDDLCTALIAADDDPAAAARETMARLGVDSVPLRAEAAITSHPPGGPVLTTHLFTGVGPAPRGTTGCSDAEIVADHTFGTRLQTPALRVAIGQPAERREWSLARGISVLALRTPTLPPATRTNCYLVGTRELAVVDPATPHLDEQRALDSVLAARRAGGARLVAVVLTHHHNDHVADAARLAAAHGVPICAHPETARLLAGRLHVTRLLADGDVIELAGEPRRRLRAVFTPGHAPGHHCFIEESTGFCIAGDMVAGVGSILIDPSEGDMGDYLASLQRLLEAEAVRLLPAHGPVLTDPRAALQAYTAHRLWREARVLSALREAADARVTDLVVGAYADVVPALHGLAGRSLLSHLLKLERDGKATRSGDRWQPT